MAERYSVVTPCEYEKNGKKETFFQKLGMGFVTKSGKLCLKLNGLPLNGTLIVSKDEPKEQRSSGGYGVQQSNRPPQNDEDVPF